MADQTLYDQLGGETGLRRLCERFYHHMNEQKQFRLIRDLHPADLDNARERLLAFLSGWAGGPQVYAEKYGHPRLRMRHMPFSIGKEERDQWLQCMLLALDDIGLKDPQRFFVMDALMKVADHMRNRDDG